jgi:hypothetical protein
VTGAAGGRAAMHASCAAAFAGSHMCHVAEYNLTDSATPLPANGAWVDASAVVDISSETLVFVDGLATRDAGRYTGRGGAFASSHDNCANWTTTSDEGLSLGTSGSFTGVLDTDCSTAHAIACCATVYREQFRGFTSATMTGAAGGRTQMHAACGREFAGSHLCHAAEYDRATSPITPPATGAWLDASGFPAPSGSGLVDNVAGSRIGRVAAYGESCDNWTSGDAGHVGLAVEPGGSTEIACSLVRPLACCE